MAALSVPPLLATCAADRIPAPAGLERYRAAAVEVTGTTGAGRAEIARLRGLIIEELRQEELFERVNTTADGGLLIRATITEVRHVSNLRRIDLGRLADSNEVTVEFELIDSDTRARLSAFRLTGVSPERAPLSAEWPWGSVPQALQKVAARLARLMEQWMARGPR